MWRRPQQFASKLITTNRALSEARWGKHWRNRGWLQEYSLYWQKQMVLLKGLMVNKYRVEFHLPLSMTKTVFPMSLSDLAGHGSFLFLALSYLESDFLNLRLYATSGIVLSIIFQYYREKPLWIPIRWNSLFLVINAMMIVLLMKEHNDAQNIPDEEKYLFETIFAKKDMKPVDFMHLIGTATRSEHTKGQIIISESQRHNRVYLVKKGKLSVKKHGMTVRYIKSNQFVGAMSFLSWEEKLDVEKLDRSVQKEIYDSWNSESVNEESSNPLIFLYEAARSASAQTSILTANATTSAVATTAKPVLDALHQQSQQHHHQHHHHHHVAATSGDSFSGNTVLAEEDEEDYHEGEEDKEGEEGHADVVCERDCVLYSWGFKELRQLVYNNPSLGLAFERALSEDLNRKMTTSLYNEPKQRYLQMLTGACMDGETTDLSKKILEDYRKEKKISYAEHLEMLRSIGWTEHDFAAGYQGAPEKSVLETYEAMLAKALKSKKGKIAKEDKRKLRQFRKDHRITAEAHLAALRRLGWTMDDYEEGDRASSLPYFLDSVDIVSEWTHARVLSIHNWFTANKEQR